MCEEKPFNCIEVLKSMGVEISEEILGKYYEKEKRKQFRKEARKGCKKKKNLNA